MFPSSIRQDVYALLNRDTKHEADPELATKYSMSIGANLAKATQYRGDPRDPYKLWASDLGKDCMRKHYFNLHEDHEPDPLSGPTTFKFLYGNIIEDAALYLVEEAGHKVDHLQRRVEESFVMDDGHFVLVSGRIDAEIDGFLVDVKSSSTYGFKEVMSSNGLTKGTDKFGYLWQLSFYHHFSDIAYDGAGFLWVDRDRGEIYWDNATTNLYTKEEVEQRVKDVYKAIHSKTVPERDKKFNPVPQSGTSPNMKLCTNCSYCDYKVSCWKDANGGTGLRKFVYSNGPVWLTDVTKVPNVYEEIVNA